MRILLGFRHAKLLSSGGGDDLSEQVVHRLRRKQGPEPRVEVRAVAGYSRGAGEVDGARARKAVETRVEERGQDLPHAIRSEIEAEQAVAVLHAPIIADAGGDDELVRYILRVSGRDHGCGIGKARALSLSDRQIGLFDALPSVVAIHRVIAAGDGRDFSNRRKRVAKRAQEVAGRARRRVASIREGVDQSRHAGLGEQSRQRGGVVLMRVHAAGRYEAEQVACAARAFERFDQRCECPRLTDAPVLDCLGDARQLLHHDAPRADIEVADFRVPHLPVRQTDIPARGAQEGVRAALPQSVEGRSPAEPDSVVRLFLAPTPAIQHDEHHRPYLLRLRHLLRSFRAPQSELAPAVPGNKDSDAAHQARPDRIGKDVAWVEGPAKLASRHSRPRAGQVDPSLPSGHDFCSPPGTGDESSCAPIRNCSTRLVLG